MRGAINALAIKGVRDPQMSGEEFDNATRTSTSATLQMGVIYAG
jgi:hypothetical protein